MRTFIEAYVNHLPAAVATNLLADYESDAALAQTYVGYAGSTNWGRLAVIFASIGPRVWIEFSARPGVAYSFPHWHTVWRDKLTDYGAAFGTNTISTANRLPTITSSPSSRTNEVDTSTTFTVGTGRGVVLSMAAERRRHQCRDECHFHHRIGNPCRPRHIPLPSLELHGTAHRSSAAVLTVPPTNPPAISSAGFTNGIFAMQIAGDLGPNYIIQGSTNLTDWESLYSTNPAAMPFHWIDPAASEAFPRVFSACITTRSQACEALVFSSTGTTSLSML